MKKKKKKLNSVFEMEHVHNVLYPQAIMETAFTRVVLPMPIFVLPPIIMSYLERFVQKYIVKIFFPVRVRVATSDLLLLLLVVVSCCCFFFDERSPVGLEKYIKLLPKVPKEMWHS